MCSTSCRQTRKFPSPAAGRGWAIWAVWCLSDCGHRRGYTVLAAVHRRRQWRSSRQPQRSIVPAIEFWHDERCHTCDGRPDRRRSGELDRSEHAADEFWHELRSVVARRRALRGGQSGTAIACGASLVLFKLVPGVTRAAGSGTAFLHRVRSRRRVIDRRAARDLRRES